MTGCFDGEGTVHAFIILSESFVDNILVASLKAEMLSAEILFDKGLESGGGNGICNDHTALVIFESNSSSKSNETVTIDLITV